MPAEGPVRRQILVVDDDQLLCRSVERALVRAGHVVHTAPNARSARHLAERYTIDLALVDYGLGREDGLSVLSELRERQPSCLRVLMTGRTDFPMVVEAINRGEVVRVLRKPFQAPELLHLLDDALDAARRSEEAAAQRMQGRTRHELRMLEECLDVRRLRLALQPIVRPALAPGSEVVAYEALLRPQHPYLDNPGLLLAAAERHERVGDVGSAVLTLAGEWVRRLPPSVGLFVNLHPEQLGDPARLARDLEPLAPYAGRITLEITERSRLQDIARWDESVRWIGEGGFSVAVDDLGAGYSSLIMLADLQPQYIKLDMSLVRNIHEEPRKQRLVQLMVTFAEATQALAIAEGVETRDEARALMDCGIHLVQGHYFGRPTLDLP